MQSMGGAIGPYQPPTAMTQGPASLGTALGNMGTPQSSTGMQTPNFQMTPQQQQQADQLRAQMTARMPGGQNPMDYLRAASAPAGRMGGALNTLRPPPGAPAQGAGGGKAPGQPGPQMKQQIGQLPGAPPPGAPGRGPGQAKGNPQQNLAMKQQIAGLQGAPR